MNALKRISTRVPGLDGLLGGGLLEGGVYFIQGEPGTGKTTLANQICFGQASEGGHALYLTLLAESHARMLQHMLGHTFYDASLVGKRITYVNGYQSLAAEGLASVIAMLRSELARHRAAMVVIDGMVLPATTGQDEDNVRLKEFVHALQSLATLMGCNVLLLTSGKGRSVAAEQTMVDGILNLENVAVGMRYERQISVSKFRGSATARGVHAYCVTDEGLHVYQRLETLDIDESMPGHPALVGSTGLASLDALFGAGGPHAGTVTLVRGSSGCGKTLLGLQSLARSSGAEPGLLFGFSESPSELLATAAGIGIELAPLLATGVLELNWVGPDDHALDQLGHRLLELVDRRGVRRLVVDSLAGFADKGMFGERGFRFVGTLFAALRRRGVSTLLVSDDDALASLEVPHVARGLPALADQVVEISSNGDLRTLRILKARRQRFEPLHQSWSITDKGLAVSAMQSARKRLGAGPG